MKLTFGTHDKHETLVTEFTTFKECWDVVNKYLEENKYRHSGYDRVVGLSDKEIMIDFGSWTEFFFIDASFEDFMVLQKEDAKLKGDDPNRGRVLDTLFEAGSRPIRFKQIVDEMAETYEKKNHDYGNSFETTLDKFGPNIALARIEDKLNRASNLLNGTEADVKDEKIEDTLKDLATYSIMLLMWKEKQNDNRNS